MDAFAPPRAGGAEARESGDTTGSRAERDARAPRRTVCASVECQWLRIETMRIDPASAEMRRSKNLKLGFEASLIGVPCPARRRRADDLTEAHGETVEVPSRPRTIGDARSVAEKPPVECRRNNPAHRRLPPVNPAHAHRRTGKRWVGKAVDKGGAWR